MRKLFRMVKQHKLKVSESYIKLYGIKKGEKEYKTITRKVILLSVLVLICSPLFVYAGNTLLESFLITVILIIMLFELPGFLIKRNIKAARLSYEMEMPDFLERTAMLLDAGQTLWEAIEKAVISDDECTLNGELNRMIKEMKEQGFSEKDPCTALCNMAKRCGSSSVSSFVSMIVQNSRKGSDELIEMIRIQASMCRSERRNIAKKLGERATTLMLLPSTMIFIAILLMLISPALSVIYSI